MAISNRFNGETCESGGQMNRREFFRKSSAAALGVAAFGAGAGKVFAAEELTVNGLPATILGRTGLKVTKISFGGILLTEPPVLIRAIEQGINYIHTAPGYQNGHSMEAFGKVMKTHRDKVVLALKERPENLDSCLKVLNTDYVDVLVPPMHSVNAINHPSVQENFEKAKKAGKCGYMGYACHSSMTDVLNRSRELGYYDVALLAYNNMGDADYLEALRKAREAGIGLMAMKGLRKRFSEDPTPEETAQITSLCGSMVNKQHAHTVLPSMGSFQAVDMFKDILQTKLGYYNPELEKRYWAQQEGNYCSMCGLCSKDCPEAENISRVLRYRMYYKDYGLQEYARNKYAALNLGADSFSGEVIQRAEKICTRSLPLKEMIQEAHSLLT